MTPEQSKDYDAIERYLEIYQEQIEKLVSEAKRVNFKGRVSWQVINAARLKKIWVDFGKLGFVRDEKGLDDICEIVVRNTARIKVITEILGHTPLDMRRELEDQDIYFTDKEWEEKMSDFMRDENGAWRLSDYAIQPLEKHCFNILRADAPEQKLYAIDKALNIVHCRSDLASWFVEGGQKTLTAIQMHGTAEENS